MLCVPHSTGYVYVHVPDSMGYVYHIVHDTCTSQYLVRLFHSTGYVYPNVVRVSHSTVVRVFHITGHTCPTLCGTQYRAHMGYMYHCTVRYTYPIWGVCTSL